MTSILAIVSKAIFEIEARDSNRKVLGAGDVASGTAGGAAGDDRADRTNNPALRAATES
jgi:hypothetical protein